MLPRERGQCGHEDFAQLHAGELRRGNDVRLHPHEIAKTPRFADLDGRDVLHRQPHVLSRHEELEAWSNSGISVDKRREAAAIERSRNWNRLRCGGREATLGEHCASPALCGDGAAIPDPTMVVPGQPWRGAGCLGRSVRRKLSRHYLGRVFATVAAFAMGLGVYDTQCGAKLFRVSEGFVDRLQEPFIGGWIFDVEMIAREIRARRGTDLPPVSSVIYEHPLLVWRDVAGSKIRPIDWFKVGINLGRIYFKYLV